VAALQHELEDAKKETNQLIEDNKITAKGSHLGPARHEKEELGALSEAKQKESHIEADMQKMKKSMFAIDTMGSLAETSEEEINIANQSEDVASKSADLEQKIKMIEEGHSAKVAEAALALENDLLDQEAELNKELALGDPDHIMSAQANAERRRRLKLTRERLNASESLDMKLKDRLLKKLGDYEEKMDIADKEGGILQTMSIGESDDVEAARKTASIMEIVSEIEDGLVEVEKEIALQLHLQDPDAIINDAANADRQARIRHLQDKAKGSDKLSQKLKERLAKKGQRFGGAAS